MTAKFNQPWGVAADEDGNVYVADQKSYRIRKIETTTDTELANGSSSGDSGLILQFTLSEAATNFGQDDITVTNGSLSLFAALSATEYTAKFTPAAGGVVTIEVAGDAFTDAAGNNNTASPQYVWTYDPPNTAPVADAGQTQTVMEGISVTLDGSASSDVDTGDTLAYTWAVPAGITLSDTSLAKPTFTAPDVSQSTDYTFTLTVSDGSANSSATVVVTVLPSATQTLSLKAGWNLVSFYVEASDMATATVLSPISAKLSQIKNLSELYDPSVDSALNTLASLDVRDGYWLNVTEDVSLQVTGIVPSSSSIPVNSGWNLVGYPRATGASPADELTSLGNSVLQVKNLTESYDPDNPTFLNTMTTMTPWLGYWLKVTADGTWSLGQADDHGGNRDIAKAQPTPLGPDWGRVKVFPNLGATVLARVTIEGLPAPANSVVGAFVGGELRGSHAVVLSGGQSYVSLNVNLNGTESVTYRVWNALGQAELSVTETMKLELGEVYGRENLVQLNAEAGTRRPLRLVSLSRNPLAFAFESEVGQRYVVESSGDLRTWKPVETLQGNGESVHFEPPNTSDDRANYYRLCVE